MLKKTAILLLALLAALVPGAVLAQDSSDRPDDEGFLLRVNGNLVVREGETISTIFVIRGDVIIEGTVSETIIVINGDAVVRDGGVVGEDVIVLRGNLALSAGAQINNATLINSTLDREPGSTVTGDITEERGIRFGFLGVALGVWFWVSMTVAVILAGLIFAAVGGHQLNRAGNALTADAGFSIFAAVIVWIGLPIVAGLALITIVGIPFGIGILLVLLPALWFLGYIVVGTRIGVALLGRVRGEATPPAHPYLGAFLGLLLLQLLGLIPVVGWAIVVVAGLYGAGALALIAARATRGPGRPLDAAVAPPPPPPPPTPGPAGG